MGKEQGEQQQQNIVVCVRMRPLSDKEKESSRTVWKVGENQDCIYRSDVENPECMNYDFVFGDKTQTSEIYGTIVKSMVDSTIEGFNSTIFAYGQTSSGKTFTMSGEEDNPGIIPLAVNDIFKRIEDSENREFLLRVSYTEIYNEIINDLLNAAGTNLKIHEDFKKGIYIANLHEEIVVSREHVIELMKKGGQSRMVAETQSNERSSRSHTIFRIVVESRAIDQVGGVKVGVLNLVDLAGSERAKTAGTEGLRLREGGHINKSLLCLGTVIRALSSAGNSGHVPFRDSKLTRILQPSLGGNTKTAIVCNITPAAAHVEETSSTLQFASRAKHIKNKAKMNEFLDDATLLKKYSNEISSLKVELSSKEEKILRLNNLILGNNEMKSERRSVYVSRLSSVNQPNEEVPVGGLRRETWCPTLPSDVGNSLEIGPKELSPQLMEAKIVQLTRELEAAEEQNRQLTENNRQQTEQQEMIDSLVESLEMKQVAVERMEEAVESLQAENEELLDELQETQDQKEIFQKDLLETSSLQRKIVVKAERLEKERDVFAHRIADMEQKKSEMTSAETQTFDSASNMELCLGVDHKKELEEARAGNSILLKEIATLRSGKSIVQQKVIEKSATRRKTAYQTNSSAISSASAAKEVGLMRKDIERLEAKCKDLESRNKSLSRDKSTTRTAMANLEGEARRLKTSLLALTNETEKGKNGASKQLKELQNNIEKLQKQHASDKSAVSELKEKCLRLEEEVSCSRGTTGQNEAKIKELSSLCEENERRLRENESDLEAARSRLSEVERDREEALSLQEKSEAELQKMYWKIQEMESALKKAEEMSIELTDKKNKMSVTLDSLQKEREEQKDEAKNLREREEEYTRLCEQHAETLFEVEGLKSQVTQLQVDIVKLETAAEEQNSTIAKLQKEKDGILKDFKEKDGKIKELSKTLVELETKSERETEDLRCLVDSKQALVKAVEQQLEDANREHEKVLAVQAEELEEEGRKKEKEKENHLVANKVSLRRMQMEVTNLKGVVKNDKAAIRLLEAKVREMRARA